MPTYSFSSTQQNIYLQKIVLLQKNIISVLKKVWSSTKDVEQVNGPLIDASTSSQGIWEDINVTLKRLWHSHLNVIFSYLNINSITNKFGD